MRCAACIGGPRTTVEGACAGKGWVGAFIERALSGDDGIDQMYPFGKGETGRLLGMRGHALGRHDEANRAEDSAVCGAQLALPAPRVRAHVHAVARARLGRAEGEREHEAIGAKVQGLAHDLPVDVAPLGADIATVVDVRPLVGKEGRKGKLEALAVDAAAKLKRAGEVGLERGT